MTTAPDVSVVMGVYNGAHELRQTVQSVLAQQGVNFEFIIVDDGSTDESAGLLAELAAADPRVRVIPQENRGLTRALVRGCAAARGRVIARQDCGDLSLASRLARQLELMESHPEAALVSCGARFVGPAGEPMYDVVPAQRDATASLLTLDLGQLRGPAHHGCTMFRRDLYERVGGYREQFYFAQDLDLWTRLAEHGRHITMADILYEARFALNSISSLQRSRQVALTSVILECARSRRVGLSEDASLARARSILPQQTKHSSWTRAGAMYFVGACLQRRTDPRARGYFCAALRICPLHVKSAARLLMR